MARRSVCMDRTNKSLCDLEIIAGTGTGIDEELPVLAHKVFLYGVSGKWKELIESAVNGKIFIPQISREIMENIITYIYADYTTEPQPLAIDDENLGKYWDAARFLQMEDVEDQCLQYFDSKTITLDNFSILFKWTSIFGPDATKPKMEAFLTQNPQQIPEIIRRCKMELKIPESDVSQMVIDWLPSSGGEICGLDMKKVVRQFSSNVEKIKLLLAFSEAGKSEWKEEASTLIRNLCKGEDEQENEDSDSESDRDANRGSNISFSSSSVKNQVQSPADSNPNPQSGSSSKVSARTNQSKSKSNSTPETVQTPAAPTSASFSSPFPSTSKSTPFSRGPSKRTSSQIGLNSNSSSCQATASTSAAASAPAPKTIIKRQLRPAKKQKMQNSSTSTRSSRNATVANPERENLPEQQEQMQVDNDDSSFSASPSSSSNALQIQRTRMPGKNNKLAQNPDAEGTIYFPLDTKPRAGGNHFWSFNLRTKEFGPEAQMPPSFQDCKNFGMIYWKEEIYFMGGESYETGIVTKKVRVFNLTSGEWTEMEMLDPRYDFQACVLNGEIYAVGGCEESPVSPLAAGKGISAVEKLAFTARQSSNRESSSRGNWERVDCMENCRADAGIVALEGKIYAIGGYVGGEKKDMEASNLCEVFDPEILLPENQWNPIAPMNFKRLELAAVATTNPNRIYALGGALESLTVQGTTGNSKRMNTVEIYDPSTNSWTTGPPMNKPRKFFSAVFFDNCIYALGGDSDTRPTMEKLDLLTPEWILQGNLKKEGNYSTVAFKSSRNDD